MRVGRVFSFLVLVAAAATVRSQSPAAMQHLLAHYSPDEVQDMQQNAHYRYEAELLYYSASFLVAEGANYRAPTEAEIASIDLHLYDGLRAANSNVVVFDTATGLYLRLLGRQQFEELMLERLSAADRAAYLAYRASARRMDEKTRR